MFNPDAYAPEGTPRIVVDVLPLARAYAAVAGGMATVGLLLASRVQLRDWRRLQAQIARGLAVAFIPLTVSWVVLLEDWGDRDVPIIWTISAATTAVATLLLAFAGGLWLCHWRWLRTSVLVLIVTTLFWGEAYVWWDLHGRFHAQSFAELVLLMWCTPLILGVTLLATLGIVLGRC